MCEFDKLYYLIMESITPVRVFNSMVRLPMKKPYGFWMDRHGNFAVVEGGQGMHEKIGSKILEQEGVGNSKTVYDTLFSMGWVRIMITLGKVYYEVGLGQRLTPIQRRNLSFINDFYELKGVQEG